MFLYETLWVDVLWDFFYKNMKIVCLMGSSRPKVGFLWISYLGEKAWLGFLLQNIFRTYIYWRTYGNRLNNTKYIVLLKNGQMSMKCIAWQWRLPVRPIFFCLYLLCKFLAPDKKPLFLTLCWRAWNRLNEEIKNINFSSCTLCFWLSRSYSVYYGTSGAP